MTISLDGFVADQNGNAGRLLRDTAYMTGFVTDGVESAVARAKAAAHDKTFGMKQ
jgi:hypothetical protein